MKKTVVLAWLCIVMLATFAQNRTISGKVTDKNGNPLPGVTISIPGTKQGFQTSPDGSFNIPVTGKGKSLVFSTVGYASQQISIGNQSSFAITMELASTNLNEVVVVGYGTVKKANLTAAVSKVNGDKLENVPLASIDQTLQGKVPGLQSI